MRGDVIDRLSEAWSARYAGIQSGPWQVWARLWRVHESFVSAASRALKPHGLDYKEFQTLGALVLFGEPYIAAPKDLARYSLLTSGGTTLLMKRLERKGLIRRSRSTTDMRGVCVQLTEQGLRKFDEALANENRIEHKMLDPLSREERDQLIALLRKLMSARDT